MSNAGAGTADPFSVGIDDDFIYYLRLGGESLRAGKIGEARTALELAYGLRPDNSRAQNLLGLAYFKLGLLEAAKAIYDRLVRDYSEEPSLHVNLGLVLLRQGRLPEAEESFRRALDIKPGHGRAHCYLGLVLYRRGRLEEAREHFIKGDAKEFAERVDHKLAVGGGSSRDHDARVIDEVVAEGVQRVSTAPPESTFRPIQSLNEEQVLRNEEGWEEQIGHGRTEVSDEFHSPSLLSVLSPANDPRMMIPDADTEEMPRSQLLSAARDDDADVSSYAIPLVEPSLQLFEDLDWAAGFCTDAALSPVARLILDNSAYVRSRAVMAVFGQTAVQPVPHPEKDDAFGGTADPFCRIEGHARILLRVKHFAVGLRDARDLVVRTAALTGFEGTFDWKPAEVAGLDVVRLSGVGSLLLDADAAPVVTQIEVEDRFMVSPDEVLAWTVSLGTSDIELAEGVRLLQFSGAGFVILAGPREARRRRTTLPPSFYPGAR